MPHRRASRSRLGRCLTSWHVWSSPSSCIARAPSSAASRITSDPTSRVTRPLVLTVPPGWFRALAPSFGEHPHTAAQSRLARVVETRGALITTGQQPGLFGGPLLTLVKALSARAIADALERTTGVPVAPVFWAATDDADFEAAARVAVVRHGSLDILRHDSTAPAGTPMAGVALGNDLPALVHRLVSAC